MRKVCKDCGREYPETREFFGQYKNRYGGRTTIGFRNSCRQCMRDRSSAHAKANPDQRRERMARRIDREDNATGSYSEADNRFIREQLRDCCRYCGEKLNGSGEIDHLTPVARGGTNRIENLTLSCMPCNRAKLSKTLEEFLEWRTERTLTVIDFGPDYERPDTPTSSVQRRKYR